MSLDPEGLKLIETYNKIDDELRSHKFPQLIAGTKEDEDGEQMRILTCPWCLLDAINAITAHDAAFRETECQEAEEYDLDGRIISFSSDDRGDFEPTAYYNCQHCGNPVDLPDGYDEEWN